MAKSLELETGISTGWTENGGLFIADNAERLAEYQRLATIGKFFDIESKVLTPAQTKELYPLINPNDVLGALYSPGDGTIDPSGWVSALAKASRGNGAHIYENTPVVQIETQPSTFGRQITGVRTKSGHLIKTKTVVNCAGVWANKVADLVNVQVPLCAMHHAYVVTERIDGIQNMPNIRDHDASVYLKVQGDVLQVGGYERNPVYWKEIQDDFAFSLFDLDWDAFGSHIEGAVNRVPVIGTIGIRSTVCGPESFTPDHKALLGQVPSVKGFFLGCGFNSAGIMLAGGCGSELAKWVVNGYPELDMLSYDINRFHPSMGRNRQWVEETSHESYAKNYAIVFPQDEPLAGRNLRIDPLFKQMKDANCVFQMRHGWERPGYFTLNSAAVQPYDFYESYGYEAHQNYRYRDEIQGNNTFGWPKNFDLVAQEVLACRNQAVVFNQSYFGKFIVSGPDAPSAMDWICTNNLQKPVGTVVYTNMCSENGCVQCDLTVSRIGEEEYYIAAGGTTATHDLEWIRQSIAAKGLKNYSIQDITDHLGLLSLQGPESRALMSCLAPNTDFSDEGFPFSTTQMIKIGKYHVRAIRLTFVGELGWELHIPKEACAFVYQEMMKLGRISNAGYHAIDSMSAEKGYKHYHEDLRADDTPLEAGLGFICKLKTSIDFCGRDALEKQKSKGLKKKLSCFTLDQHFPLHGGEAIWRNNECVGFIRRASFGHSIGKSIGYGYIHSESISKSFLNSGKYEIEILNQTRVPATFHPKVLFDPRNDRPKGIYSLE